MTPRLGEVGDAAWADWIDLGLPWLVVATAGACLLTAPADRRARLLGAVGLVAYVQGHGVHLAANSIATRDGGDTAYLWDELVGHAIWYAGLYLVVAALVLATRDTAGRPGPLRLLLALAVGVTFATNAIGGHAVPLALVANPLLLALAWRRRTGTALDLLLASAAALVTLAAYGAAGALLGWSVDHT